MPTFSKLKKRKDFVYVTKSGVSVPTRSIVLQAVFRKQTTQINEARIGYTTTKKIGKAVIRNRCRRRLRAAAALLFADLAFSNADYVLIARYSTEKTDFKDLCNDLKNGLIKINKLLNGEKDNAPSNHQTPVSVAD